MTRIKYTAMTAKEMEQIANEANLSQVQVEMRDLNGDAHEPAVVLPQKESDG